MTRMLTIRPQALKAGLLLIFGAVGLATNLLIATASRTTWHIDFNEFYSAGKLAGTGRLYDWDSLRRIEEQQGTAPLPIHRPPVFAAGFKMLTWLPFRTAVVVWFGICLAAVVGFVLMSPFGRHSTAALVCCWSQPLAATLAFGQDDTLLLFYGTLAVCLLAKKRDATAGVAFALCVAKPNIGVAIPVLLVAQRKWRAFAAATTFVLAVLAVSTAMEGPEWPGRLISMLRLPVSDPGPERMPILRGIALWLPAHATLEALFAAGVLVLLWRVLVLHREAATSGAVAMAAGLILGRHGYIHDAALLIPLVVLLIDRPAPSWLKLWAVVAASPFPYLLLLTPWPPMGQLLLVGFTVTALGWLAAPKSRTEIALPVRQ